MNFDRRIAGVQRHQGRRARYCQGYATAGLARIAAATATATCQGPHADQDETGQDKWRQLDWRHREPRDIDTRCADNGRDLTFRRELMTFSREFVINFQAGPLKGKKRGRIQ
jgi:hypothetical protein